VVLTPFPRANIVSGTRISQNHKQQGGVLLPRGLLVSLQKTSKPLTRITVDKGNCSGCHNLSFCAWPGEHRSLLMGPKCWILSSSQFPPLTNASTSQYLASQVQLPYLAPGSRGFWYLTDWLPKHYAHLCYT